MGELIQRFGPMIAGAFLIWYAWTALDEGGGMVAQAKASMPEVGVASLSVRMEGEPLESTGDPFQSEWAPYGPEYTPEAVRERKQAEDDARRARAKAEQERRDRERRERMAREKEKAKAPPPSFTMRLEAVLDFGTGGTARISGRTVSIGDPIEDLDEEHPPVLTGVRGTSVEIAHRGKTYRLDLTGEATVKVTPPPPQPEKAPVQASAPPESDEPAEAEAEPKPEPQPETQPEPEPEEPASDG